jgi:hypothetical protein
MQRDLNRNHDVGRSEIEVRFKGSRKYSIPMNSASFESSICIIAWLFHIFERVYDWRRFRYALGWVALRMVEDNSCREVLWHLFRLLIDPVLIWWFCYIYCSLPLLWPLARSLAASPPYTTGLLPTAWNHHHRILIGIYLDCSRTLMIVVHITFSPKKFGSIYIYWWEFSFLFESRLNCCTFNCGYLCTTGYV